MKPISACVVCACAVAVLLFCVPDVRSAEVCAGATSDDPIKYYIVLMMENRSFDHFLGWLTRENPDVMGLTGKEFNLADPSDPTSQKYTVDDKADLVDPDFDHGIPGVAQEIQWGAANDDAVTQTLMNGFVAQNNRHNGEGPLAVSMFNSTTLPILSTLALNFALFDQYFADVPGPTMPNRFFFMSGTSHGLGDNHPIPIGFGLPQESIFDRLNQWDIDWRVYQETVASVLGLLRMREPHNLERVRDLLEFFKAVADENLRPFSWLEPSYWAIPELNILPRDQHPTHPVQYGEELIKSVYESVRNSPYWACSAIIVTYDEHGGFADFSPMELDVPNPDGRNSRRPLFNFDRLGIRVPFVVVSPWVDAEVVHQPDASIRPTPNSQFSHSSLAATLQNIFDPTGPALTNRTAWSAPFDFVWKQRSTMREDTPQHLPQPYETGFSKDKPKFWSAQLPMNQFQIELAMIARQMCLDNANKCQLAVPSLEDFHRMTEREGGLFSVGVMRSLGLLTVNNIWI